MSAVDPTTVDCMRRYRRRLASGDQFFRGDLPYNSLATMIDHGLIEHENAADLCARPASGILGSRPSLSDESPLRRQLCHPMVSCPSLIEPTSAASRLL
jgi:hypothetical protein